MKAFTIDKHKDFKGIAADLIYSRYKEEVYWMTRKENFSILRRCTWVSECGQTYCSQCLSYVRGYMPESVPNPVTYMVTGLGTDGSILGFTTWKQIGNGLGNGLETNWKRIGKRIGKQIGNGLETDWKRIGNGLEN